MTELKTLKDLARIYENIYSNEIFVEDLKAEVIKWVKEAKKLNDGTDYHKGIVNFCAEFFNLTEEDLK